MGVGKATLLYSRAPWLLSVAFGSRASATENVAATRCSVFSLRRRAIAANDAANQQIAQSAEGEGDLPSSAEEDEEGGKDEVPDHGENFERKRVSISVEGHQVLARPATYNRVHVQITKDSVRALAKCCQSVRRGTNDPAVAGSDADQANITAKVQMAGNMLRTAAGKVTYCGIRRRFSIHVCGADGMRRTLTKPLLKVPRRVEDKRSHI